MTKYHPLPQPEDIPIREREDAMGAYLMMFAALAAGLPLPILNLIAAIIYLFVNRSKSKFVYYHALHSLYAQLPLTLLNAGLVFWAIRIYFFDAPFDGNFKGYIGLVVVANLIYFIFSIIAAVKARRGEFYYFIFFGRLAYQQAYLVRAEKGSKAAVNKPPKM
jgi:uncharacterized membrane protein